MPPPKEPLRMDTPEYREYLRELKAIMPINSEAAGEAYGALMEKYLGIRTTIPTDSHELHQKGKSSEAAGQELHKCKSTDEGRENLQECAQHGEGARPEHYT